MKVLIRIPNYVARVKAWARDVRRQAEAWRGEDWFFNGAPHTRADDSMLAWYVIQVLVERARFRVMAQVCRAFDHLIVVEEGNANNPYVDAHCSRCGHCWKRGWF